MLRQLVVGQLQTNCYIVADRQGLEGVIIDPGDESYRILRAIEGLGITIKYILLTHGHFDHTGAAHELRSSLKAPVAIHPLDRRLLDFEPDILLQEKDRIQVGKYGIDILHVPGHSPGSLCYSFPGVLFCGDVLFSGSIGRTDFPGGSHHRLISGIKEKVLPLGDEVRVYPGHGPQTTIGHERRFNPFLL